jgi:TolB-like protein/Flp pilus assembly protein TadD
MPDIFLSYNREDAATAQLFAEAFTREGMEVWWDATLRSGEAYDEVTETALRQAKVVVVLWSPRSVISRWVRAEATIADRNGTLMPATIERCDRPVMFELTQTADLSHWGGAADDEAWTAFLHDVRRRAGHGTSEPVRAVPDDSAAAAASTGNGIPIVAVLPIVHRDGDDGMGVLAADLTEDITRELSQSQRCKVIAASSMAAWQGKAIDHRMLGRELGARYLVEGKLQGADGQARLSVQIIDVASDSTLWSARIVRELAAIKESPEEFPTYVAVELAWFISHFDTQDALAKSGPYSAWEHVVRALSYMSRRGSDSERSAEEEALCAVAMAPDFGFAYSVLAAAMASRVTRVVVARGALEDAELAETVREIHAHIRRAIQLDGNNPATLTVLGGAYVSTGDGDAGLRLAQRAVNLAPNFPDAHALMGMSYFRLGRCADAIAAFDQELRIAPPEAYRPFDLLVLGACLFVERRPSDAEVAIDQSLALLPDHYGALCWKAIVAAELGKEQAAASAIRQLRIVDPDKSIEQYLQTANQLPVEHERKYEAIAILRKLLEDNV